MIRSSKTFATIAFACVLCFVGTGSAFAQGVNPEDQQRLDADLQREDSARREAEEARRAQQQNQRRSQRPSGATAPDPLAVPKGGPCFQIRDVEIKGHDAFGSVPEGYASLIGSCATAADIGDALNQINKHYQDKGYITTRAYLPQQDISDGILDIQVIAGRIEGYVYGGGRKADARITGAFPGKRGDLLNLRNLEQGLENINAPRSAKGKFQLIPGEGPGGSFVQVLAEDGRKYHFDLDFKNTGFDTTGVVKGTATLGVDNLFGVNDQLSLGITTTPFESRSQKYSDAISLSFTVPYKNWSFGLDAGGSRYRYILQGINETYPVAGRSQYLTASAERLVYRNQTSKLYAYGDLKLTRTRTFIDNQEIESQRRRLTIGSLGLRGEKNFPKSKFTWDVGTKFGLNIFNAFVLDKSIVDPQFKLFKTRLSYERPIKDTGITYTGVISGQFSDDILPGTEQFSVGGWSNVRGFHDDNLYGDNGVYLQNTLAWDAYKGEKISVRMNTGLDIGYVEPSDLRSWSQDHIIGVSLGADITYNNKVTLNLKLGHALDRPDDNPPNSNPAFEASRTVLYVGLRSKF